VTENGQPEGAAPTPGEGAEGGRLSEKRRKRGAFSLIAFIPDNSSAIEYETAPPTIPRRPDG
jgi:hypothetical protein